MRPLFVFLIVCVLVLPGCSGTSGWERHGKEKGFSSLFPFQPETSSSETVYQSDKPISSKIRRSHSGQYAVPVKESKTQLLLRKENSEAVPRVFTSDDGDRDKILAAVGHPGGAFPNQVVAMTLYTWEFPDDVKEDDLKRLLAVRFPADLAVAKQYPIARTGKTWWGVDAAYRNGNTTDSVRFEYERGLVKGNIVYLARIVGPAQPEWREAFFNNLELPK